MTQEEQMKAIKTQMLGMLAEENVEYVAQANAVTEKFIQQAKDHLDSVETQDEKGVVLIGLGIAMLELHNIEDYIESE